MAPAITTPLDYAHGRMAADPEHTGFRLRFYERLADCELFMMLKSEPNGDQVAPEVFPVDEKSYVLVFDTEARMVEFTETETPFVALSGRKIAEMLDGQSLGLGVNLGVAPSSILIPDEAVEWLNQALASEIKSVRGQPREVHVPVGLPEEFLRALDQKLVSAVGLADHAYLAGVIYEGGEKSRLLAFVNAPHEAEAALAAIANEAVSFSDTEIMLDIAFFDLDDPICARLDKVALKYEVPKPTPAMTQPIASAPGMDPDRPPRLK
ncbi:MAG: SseB family protein [Alphaproteobacteria bacterium]|nr:SseB family protein [Alphaproteobacteria bacterium]